MSSTSDLVDAFYRALASRDGDAMAACYHEDIVFEDPAFGELKGKDAGDMWRMLCSSKTPLTVTYTVGSTTDTSAEASWVADYTFSATDRKVRNEVTARMKLKDGKIVEHRDSFDFWKWSSQALGLPGKLLGWTPFLKGKVQSEGRKKLATFQAAISQL